MIEKTEDFEIIDLKDLLHSVDTQLWTQSTSEYETLPLIKQQYHQTVLQRQSKWINLILSDDSFLIATDGRKQSFQPIAQLNNFVYSIAVMGEKGSGKTSLIEYLL